MWLRQAGALLGGDREQGFQQKVVGSSQFPVLLRKCPGYQIRPQAPGPHAGGGSGQREHLDVRGQGPVQPDFLGGSVQDQDQRSGLQLSLLEPRIR